MQYPDVQGLKFGGTLRVDIFDDATGKWSGYERLHAEKLELKTPAAGNDQKLSKQVETYNQPVLNDPTNNPSEASIVLNEATHGIMTTMLSGRIETLVKTEGALSNIEVDVIPGKWVDIGYDNLDLAELAVTNVAGTTTYVTDTDYAVDALTGMIFVPVNGPITAGIVKLTAATLAGTGKRILGGVKAKHILRFKLNGQNLVTGQKVLIIGPRLIVTGQDAFDFLGSKLGSVPLKGVFELAPGETAPFTLEYLD